MDIACAMLYLDSDGRGMVYRWDKLALLKDLLEQGFSKTAIAAQAGVSRGLIYHLLRTGQLDPDLVAPPVSSRSAAPRAMDDCSGNSIRLVSQTPLQLPTGEIDALGWYENSSAEQSLEHCSVKARANAKLQTLKNHFCRSAIKLRQCRINVCINNYRIRGVIAQ